MTNDPEEQNPYYTSITETPLRDEDSSLTAAHSTRGKTVLSATRNTFVPRSIAATIDQLVAVIASLIAAKGLDDNMPALQTAAFLLVYLGYFQVMETAFGRTLGKLATGLIVVGVDGKPCTFRQALIRTGFRLLEVDPVILGALPAAACIFFTQYHQRLGDKVAGTVVARVKGLPG